jgi:hypothetical protein
VKALVALRGVEGDRDPARAGAVAVSVIGPRGGPESKKPVAQLHQHLSPCVGPEICPPPDVTSEGDPNPTSPVAVDVGDSDSLEARARLPRSGLKNPSPSNSSSKAAGPDMGCRSKDDPACQACACSATRSLLIGPDTVS